MLSGFYKASTRNPESKALRSHLRKSKQNIAKLFAQPIDFKSSLAPVCRWGGLSQGAPLGNMYSILSCSMMGRMWSVKCPLEHIQSMIPEAVTAGAGAGEVERCSLLTQFRRVSGILPTMARRISEAAISLSSMAAASE